MWMAFESENQCDEVESCRAIFSGFSETNKRQVRASNSLRTLIAAAYQSY